jgi:alkanesulfonate monooxygenase SsuD/methylene tetrahydromethanopterin reductase-like flavin-dependent oxidoreductase (luciferase family)
MTGRHTICPLCETELPADREIQRLWDEWTAARANAQVRGRAEELAGHVRSVVRQLDSLKRWLVTQGEDEIAERIDEIAREMGSGLNTFTQPVRDEDGLP